jgi:hypothetical protein
LIRATLDGAPPVSVCQQAPEGLRDVGFFDVSISENDKPAHVKVSKNATSKSGRDLSKPGGTGDRPPLLTVLKALRPHQWVKSLLVFIPLLASHQYQMGSRLRLQLLRLH